MAFKNISNEKSMQKAKLYYDASCEKMCGRYLAKLRIQHRQDTLVEVKIPDARGVAAGSDFRRFKQAHTFELTLDVWFFEFNFALCLVRTNAANEDLGCRF